MRTPCRGPQWKTRPSKLNTGGRRPTADEPQFGYAEKPANRLASRCRPSKILTAPSSRSMKRHQQQASKFSRLPTAIATSKLSGAVAKSKHTASNSPARFKHVTSTRPAEFKRAASNNPAKNKRIQTPIRQASSAFQAPIQQLQEPIPVAPAGVRTASAWSFKRDARCGARTGSPRHGTCGSSARGSPHRQARAPRQCPCRKTR